MGSGWGYEYEYRFLVDEDIIHRYTHFKLRDDIEFLFEMRTNFILKSGGVSMIIDSERFEMGAENSDRYALNSMFDLRLQDYWFTDKELWEFATEAGAFAHAASQTVHTRVTPIAIEMEVRTVRKFSETLAEAQDRAIVSQKMFPLLLMYNRNAFANVAKSPYRKLSLFLRGGPYLDRIDRVCPRDTVNLLEYCKSVSMEEGYCYICRRTPKIAEEIVTLEEYCGHAFHYHCFIHCMLKDTSCPRCSYSLSAAVEKRGDRGFISKYYFV